MTISKDEQEGADFDWFAVDSQRHIGHFTTAGFKYLPRSVSDSEEDLRYLTDYFDSRAPIRGFHRVDAQSISEFKEWKGDEHEGRYLASFVSMADKGLYSYDINTYVRPGTPYFRVAVPLCPITLNELPDDVRRIVQRTVLRCVSFENCSRIDYQSTLVA
jgi:hypothetical protein